jgi:RHS repeat-associated protein
VVWCYDANTDGSYGGTNEGTHYYCQDANFNVTAVVKSDSTVLERYNYTPYGEVTFLTPSFSAESSSIIANTHLYTGRERDPETGLQLNRYRYYASHLGRWLTRDPIGYDGGGPNLYEYVLGAPIDALDPVGLCSTTIKFNCEFPGYHAGFKKWFFDYVTYEGEVKIGCDGNNATFCGAEITDYNVKLEPDELSASLGVGISGGAIVRIENLAVTPEDCPCPSDGNKLAKSKGTQLLSRKPLSAS